MPGAIMLERPAANKLYTQNRELSWLRFNERVLDEADDPGVPLLERLKFVSIFTSNLDEFFMIRVGSLFALSEMDEPHYDNKTGMTPAEQLAHIYDYVRPLYRKKDTVYAKVKKELERQGIDSPDYRELTAHEVKFIRDIYKTSIKPILSPQIVDPHHPFPHLLSKELYIAALLRHKNSVILGLLPVPAVLPKITYLPGKTLRYVPTEKIIRECAGDAFGKYEVLEKNCICVTRNADISLDEDAFEEFDDFRSQMKKLLRKRRSLSVVRLEANFPMSERFSSLLCDRLQIESRQIFISDTALNMGYVFDIADKLSHEQRKLLLYPEFTPLPPEGLDLRQSLLRQVRQKDILLCYPYNSIDAFLQLIKEAAGDKNVISIRITIYRLAKRAKLVDYLCAAAENGKEVTVIMELRARFDELNNIDWSEKLEEAGCKIVYGFPELKVHSKVCLITLKEKSGISYITQVGTGNYNEKTAGLYTDLSLITARPDIGADAAELFKNLLIGSSDGEYRTLLVAPSSLKGPLLRLIEREIAKGKDGFIFIKINSLTDIDFIGKLAEASVAGVRVQLIIRGICCLLPGVPGRTDNVTVVSIVGRFLEHSRVYCFGTGEDQQLYISSADLMTRNTERRIEVACPVQDRDLKQQILQLLEAMWYDNVKARILCPDGHYVKKIDNRPPVDSQMYCAQWFAERGARAAPKDSLWRRVLRRLSVLDFSI